MIKNLFTDAIIHHEEQAIGVTHSGFQVVLMAGI